MKKSLLALLLMFNVSILGSALNNIPKFQIPEKFKDYKSYEILPAERGMRNGNPVLEKFYDIDGDNIADAIEIYPITSYDPQTDEITTIDYPILYAFDLNGDHLVETDEIVIDGNVDGLNGNERWIDITKDMPQKSEQDYGLSSA